MIGRLARAELLRVRTSRTALGVLAAMALVLVIVTVILGLVHDAQSLDHRVQLREVLSVAGRVGGLFALALGAGSVIGAHQRDAASADALVAPKRWPAVVAKAIAHALLGLGVGLVAVAITYATAGLVLGIRGTGFGLFDELPRTIALGSVLACGLLAAAGVGLAELTGARGTIAFAVVAIFVALQLSGALGDADRFLPGGGIASLTREQAGSTLAFGWGAALLGTWAAVFAVAGAFSLARRDLQ